MKTEQHAFIAENIVRHFGYESKPITIIADNKFCEIALGICAFHNDSKMILLSSYNTNNCGDVFREIDTEYAIILAEPDVYCISLVSKFGFQSGRTTNS